MNTEPRLEWEEVERIGGGNSKEVIERKDIGHGWLYRNILDIYSEWHTKGAQTKFVSMCFVPRMSGKAMLNEWVINSQNAEAYVDMIGKPLADTIKNSKSKDAKATIVGVDKENKTITIVFDEWEDLLTPSKTNE